MPQPMVSKAKSSTTQEKLLEKINLFKKSSDGNDTLNASMQSLNTKGDDEPLKSDRSNHAGTLHSRKPSDTLNLSLRVPNTKKKL